MLLLKISLKAHDLGLKIGDSLSEGIEGSLMFSLQTHPLTSCLILGCFDLALQLRYLFLVEAYPLPEPLVFSLAIAEVFLQIMDFLLVLICQEFLFLLLSLVELCHLLFQVMVLHCSFFEFGLHHSHIVQQFIDLILRCIQLIFATIQFRCQSFSLSILLSQSHL